MKCAVVSFVFFFAGIAAAQTAKPEDPITSMPSVTRNPAPLPASASPVISKPPAKTPVAPPQPKAAATPQPLSTTKQTVTTNPRENAVNKEVEVDTSIPSPGADGRVVYSFGTGLPTLACAPLRFCVVELESGEQLVSEPHIGDSVRWNISPTMFGRAETSTTIIVIKPQELGLETNLLIPTDRRVYYLRLISSSNRYTPRVAFSYPGGALRDPQWRQHLLRQVETPLEKKPDADLGMKLPEELNFDYVIRGTDRNIRPLQVFDDGQKTYIRMNPAIRWAEMPVLALVGADGKTETLNYRVKGNIYIADHLVDRAQLVSGSGKKAKKVEILRGNNQ